jgi:hypothetical protein
LRRRGTTSKVTGEGVRGFHCAVGLLWCALSVCASADRQFRHDGQIQTTYDESTGTTTVALLPMPVRGSEVIDAVGRDTASIHIMAGFSTAGRTLATAPATFEFYVILKSPNAEPSGEALALKAELDKETVALGSMRIVRNRPTRVIGQAIERQFREYTLYTAVPAGVFGRLASARKARLQVAHEKFELGKNILEALRDLESRGPAPTH